MQRRNAMGIVARRREERRESKLYTCDIGVQINLGGAHASMWGRCTDISEAGCYVDTRSPLSTNTPLEIGLFFDDQRQNVPAIVRTSSPGMGMGLKFDFPNQAEAESFALLIREKFERKDTRVLAPIAVVAEHSSECPKLSALATITRATLEWASVTPLKPSERESLERLAVALGRELHGAKKEISERANKASA